MERIYQLELPFVQLLVTLSSLLQWVYSWVMWINGLYYGNVGISNLNIEGFALVRGIMSGECVKGQLSYIQNIYTVYCWNPVMKERENRLYRATDGCKWGLEHTWSDIGLKIFHWSSEIRTAHNISLLHCIVFIHFYSASHSMRLSEALPTSAIDTVSEFTRRSTTCECKWRTCQRSLRGG